MGFPPRASTTGDIESMNRLAGQSAGLVHNIESAGDVVRRLVTEARAIIERLEQTRGW